MKIPRIIATALLLFCAAAIGQGIPSVTTATGKVSPIMGAGVYLSAPPTLANTGTTPTLVDAAGNLLVNCLVGCSGGGGGSNAAAGATGSAVPAYASYTAFNSGGNTVGVSSANPFPVTAASLPLPTGAATSALQTTGNASLATIATNTPSLGQTTMSGSVPVTMASNQVAFPITESDGATVASNVAGDTGQNARIVTGGRKEVSFTTTTAQAVATTDVSNYSCVSVHITSSGTGSLATFQASNDNTNWVTNLMTYESAAAGFAAANFAASSTNHIFVGPLTGRFFRLNVTGISAGTTAGVIEFYSSCRPLIASLSSATVLNTLMPISATRISADSGVVAAATATATLAASSGKLTFIDEFQVTGAGATAASVITCTITGTISGTKNYVLTIPAGTTTGVVALRDSFNPPLQSSTTNTAIAVSCPSFGSGNTAAAITASGYQQ